MSQIETIRTETDQLDFGTFASWCARKGVRKINSVEKCWEYDDLDKMGKIVSTRLEGDEVNVRFIGFEVDFN